MTKKLAKKVSYAFGSQRYSLTYFSHSRALESFINNNFGSGSVIHSYPFVHSATLEWHISRSVNKKSTSHVNKVFGLK
jgi:hypothetical protein